MSFKVMSPGSEDELMEQLEKMSKNASHVVGVRVDDQTSSIQLSLDGKAHFFGYPDIQIPVQKDKLGAAKEIVSRLEGMIRNGTPPGNSDVHALYLLLAH